MQEKQHALYIFNLLKNLIKPSSDGPPLRLPSFASLILSHALRGVFYPSNFIYPRTARFLLQRPELDVTDVPMLYSMLYGSSDDWKKERGWIIRFLSDGMMSTEDWKVLKRRHTWELLSSLVQSSTRDQALRRAVLEVGGANTLVNSEFKLFYRYSPT
jgi:nucleolar pre-ribosomal-associated protein 1